MKGHIETVTLGELIAWLESIQGRGEDEPAEVVFDFCRASPDSLRGSRGDYAELALGFTFDKVMAAKDLLKMCRDAVGKTFPGYKGGDFLMGEDTQVWVDQYGDWTGTAIDGFDYDYRGIIRTKRVR